jgi:CNT family concentrative nucleoside transporter
MAWVMQKVMGTSGAESLSCTANIFVGQTEAPLLIKPFIKSMTNSELLTIMVVVWQQLQGGLWLHIFKY